MALQELDQAATPAGDRSGSVVGASLWQLTNVQINCKVRIISRRIGII
jgi:hypothetical protein